MNRLLKCFAFSALSLVLVSCSNRGGHEPTLADLYDNAVGDAAVAESSEIRPLVVIGKKSPHVTWNEDSSMVLMASFHNVPQIYTDGRTFTLDRIVWLVSARELEEWLLSHKNFDGDWSLRFKQLLGMPSRNTSTHFSLIWVKPENLMRPAFLTDIASDSMTLTFDGRSCNHTAETCKWFNDWFQDNASKSYGENGYPWTRLGYTYDWGRTDGEEYGLTEFLVLSGSEIQVQKTKDVESFVEWLLKP